MLHPDKCRVRWGKGVEGEGRGGGDLLCPDQDRVRWGRGVEGEGRGGDLLCPDQGRVLPQYFILGSRRWRDRIGRVWDIWLGGTRASYSSYIAHSHPSHSHPSHRV